MKRTLLFAVITVAAFLVFSDLGLRFVLRPPPAKPLEWPPPDMTKHGMMADDTLFWKLKPGYNGSWRLYKLAYTHELVKGKEIDWKARQRSTAPVYQGVTWQVNKTGFRSPVVSAKKAPGTKRLLFIGSSITFGWGVPAQKAFPEIVRQELDKAFPEHPFQVVNAGVPGYSSYQGLVYLHKILPGYQPDVVIAEFGINDGTMAVGKADKDWTPSFLNALRRFQLKSGWGRLFLRLFKGLAPEKSVANKRQDLEQARKSFYRVSLTGNKTRVAPADFKTNLQQMASLCREENASFFVYIPSLYNEYGEGLLTPSVNIMMPGSIPVHQALLPHSPEVLKTLFLPYDEGHLSIAGHRVVGKYIADFLKQCFNKKAFSG